MSDYNNENQVLKTYAAYSQNNSERLASSSGGVFSLLAKQILSSGGVVYGVAMSTDCRRAEYIRVDNDNNLHKLRGSKYVQAHVGSTFANVKEDLKNGLTVLFTGTGCQINGLKKFLSCQGNKNLTDNLYCVDVICHGVPSPALWRKYVDYIEDKNDAKLVKVNFRCKDNGWTNFGMREVDENHKEVFISKDEDPFMIMFLNNYSLRPSCYACKAKEIKMADITLGDFWGIENVAPEMFDNNGASIVLLRTKKGMSAFNKIEKSLKIKEVNYTESVVYNPAEYSPVDKPKRRNYFFTDMNNLSFEKLKLKYETPERLPLTVRFKIKIINILSKIRKSGVP